MEYKFPNANDFFEVLEKKTDESVNKSLSIYIFGPEKEVISYFVTNWGKKEYNLMSNGKNDFQYNARRLSADNRIVELPLTREDVMLILQAYSSRVSMSHIQQYSSSNMPNSFIVLESHKELPKRICLYFQNRALADIYLKKLMEELNFLDNYHRGATPEIVKANYEHSYTEYVDLLQPKVSRELNNIDGQFVKAKTYLGNKTRLI